MCTITTFTQEQFNEELRARIRSDASLNDDGFSLVIDGLTVVQSMDIEVILAVLDLHDFDRAWLHCRAATGMDIGVHNCHAFYTKDRRYLVMHNGIVHEETAYTFAVDSMWIPNLIDSVGLDIALDIITDKLDFANIFIIDMHTQDYYVTRATHGKLYTDNQGNYSTNPIGSINIPVAPNTMDYYPGRITITEALKLRSTDKLPKDELDTLYGFDSDRLSDEEESRFYNKYEYLREVVG